MQFLLSDTDLASYVLPDSLLDPDTDTPVDFDTSDPNYMPVNDKLHSEYWKFMNEYLHKTIYLLNNNALSSLIQRRFTARRDDQNVYPKFFNMQYKDYDTYYDEQLGVEIAKKLVVKDNVYLRIAQETIYDENDMNVVHGEVYVYTRVPSVSLQYSTYLHHSKNSIHHLFLI